MSQFGSFDATETEDERKPPATGAQLTVNPNTTPNMTSGLEHFPSNKRRATMKNLSTKAKTSKKAMLEGTKKPKDMPRRPLSAYNFFFRAERERLMTEPPKGSHDFHGQERSNNPEMFALLGKEIAKRWKDIPAEELEKYKEMAALDMERYCKEMSEYRLKRAKLRRLEGTEQSSDRVRSDHHTPLAERVSSGDEKRTGEPSALPDPSTRPLFPQELSSLERSSTVARGLAGDPYAASVSQLLSGATQGGNAELFRPFWAGGEQAPSARSSEGANASAAALQAQQIERLLALHQQQQLLQLSQQQHFLRQSGSGLSSTSASDVGFPGRTQQYPLSHRLGDLGSLFANHLAPSLAAQQQNPLHEYALQANLQLEQSQLRLVDDSNRMLRLRLLNHHQRQQQQQQLDRDALLRFLREAEEGKGGDQP